MAEAPVSLPLAGIKVIELSHVVMGSTCGLVLADMGADVTKVEKAPDGDDTRRYGGFGVGLFHFFNRNKKSLAVDLKTEAGKEILRRAIAGADVFVENFGPGAVDRLGFSYEACAEINPRLVYCSLKGFMPGPYENRPSLDNLVQMMGGLAYMTGPSGRPLRAGASVTDILGATFGALGIVTALHERHSTGKGQKVTSSLFEATAFLVAQHMSGAAITGTCPPPMPEGSNPWAIYNLFTTRTGGQIFLGIVNDKHWLSFCEHFGMDDLAAAPEYAEDSGRHEHNNYLLSRIAEAMAALETDDAIRRCERAGIPFAPVRQPDELFDDPQLVEGGGLVDTVLADGRRAPLPKIPLRMADHDFASAERPPQVGEGSRAFLASLGYDDSEVDELVAGSVVTIEEE